MLFVGCFDLIALFQCRTDRDMKKDFETLAQDIWVSVNVENRVFAAIKIKIWKAIKAIIKGC